MSECALGAIGRWLAGVLTLGCLVACGNEAEGDSCLEREAAGYMGMETAAAKALRGVDFTLERVGSCADTGHPWTTLEATVGEWSHRRDALEHLDRHGWVKQDNAFVSPDGAYRATALPGRDAGAPDDRYVTVTFVEVADEAEWARGVEEEGGD